MALMLRNHYRQNLREDDRAVYMYGEDDPIPRYRFIASWAVTGSSEGHYVHVQIVDEHGKHHDLAMGKTFQGFDHAWKLARRATELLGG
jgi:hypothetical protein